MLINKIKRLPCKMNFHDWRYASYAPNSERGDTCGICEKCNTRRVLKGFDLWLGSKVLKPWGDFLSKLKNRL